VENFWRGRGGRWQPACCQLCDEFCTSLKCGAELTVEVSSEMIAHCVQKKENESLESVLVRLKECLN